MGTAVHAGTNEEREKREGGEAREQEKERETIRSPNRLQRHALNYLKPPPRSHSLSSNSLKLRPSTTEFLGDTPDPNHSPPKETFSTSNNTSVIIFVHLRYYYYYLLWEEFTLKMWVCIATI